MFTLIIRKDGTGLLAGGYAGDDRHVRVLRSHLDGMEVLTVTVQAKTNGEQQPIPTPAPAIETPKLKSRYSVKRTHNMSGRIRIDQKFCDDLAVVVKRFRMPMHQLSQLAGLSGDHVLSYALSNPGYQMLQSDYQKLSDLIESTLHPKQESVK